LLYLGEFLWNTRKEFEVEKSDSIDFESMQGRTEIVFVVKLQTSHKISHSENNFGELN